MTVSETLVERLFAEHIRLVPVDPDAYSKYAGQADEKDSTVLTWRVKPESLQLFANALTAALSDQAARPLSEYHEDMGPMLWWFWEPPQPFKQISERVVSSAHDGCWLGEPPYVGAPHYDDWPGYHTHFTPIPLPAPPPSSTAGEG